MKKIIVAALMIAGFATAAEAKVKAKAKSASTPYAENSAIDHRFDGAASDAWAHLAQSPDPNVSFNMNALPVQGKTAVAGRTSFYGFPLSNYTLYGTQPVSMNAAYEGQYAPSWEGPARNRARNIRAYNESEPLPSNAGTKQK